VQRVMSEADARVYAYGSFFKDNKPDDYFGFKPGQGIHDIHFNQGNSGNFAGDNGPWQDGALLFHFPAENRWIAIFLAFQTQSWQVDEHGNPTGVVPPQPHPTPTPVPQPTPGVGERLRIVAAVANSLGTPDVETVTLVNASPDDVDLTGWKLSDRNRNSFPLSGAIKSGDAVRITIGAPMQLSNKGGKITLLDANGKVIDGVSYTKEQASKRGWSIVF
jgi:hypothetical protein